MARTKQHETGLQSVSFCIGIGLDGFTPQYHTISYFIKKRIRHDNFAISRSIDRQRQMSCAKSAKRKGNKLDCKRKFKTIENY